MASAIGEKKDNIEAILVASFEKRGPSMKEGKTEITPVAAAAATTSAPLLFLWCYSSEIAVPKAGEPTVTGKSHLNLCVIRKGEPPSGK